MNCFAHAYHFLDEDPWFVTGTVLPDWLSMAARKSRIRGNTARHFLGDTDRQLAALARGVTRHHEDDQWFHSGSHFVQLNLQFSVELRDLLGTDAGFRPHIAGHIVIEMLLDSFLAVANRSRLDRFYGIIAGIPADRLADSVNRMAPRPTTRIVEFHRRFVEEAWLYDYLDDSRVHYRLNRVLIRTGLPSLPVTFVDWVATARQTVYDQADRLLAGFATVASPVPPRSRLSPESGS